MNRSIFYQGTALLLSALLLVPCGYAQQQVPSDNQPQSPGAISGTSQQSGPALESRPDTGSAQDANASGDQQTVPPNKPMGTATAPYGRSTGVAASRPAGAVIAPAKQRRVRTFLIRMGIVAGAAAAIGAVAILSHSTPSHP